MCPRSERCAHLDTAVPRSGGSHLLAHGRRRHPTVVCVHQFALRHRRALRQEGATSWIGYKTHLTTTCEDDAPHLITHVTTTAGPIADGEITPERGAGSVEGEEPAAGEAPRGYGLRGCRVVSCRSSGIRRGVGWTHATGLQVAGSSERGVRGQRLCGRLGPTAGHLPRGKNSTGWSPAIDRGHNAVISQVLAERLCFVPVASEVYDRSAPLDHVAPA